MSYLGSCPNFLYLHRMRIMPIKMLPRIAVGTTKQLNLDNLSALSTYK